MVAKVNFSVKKRIQIWSIVEEAGYYHKIEKNKGVARIFQRRWEGEGWVHGFKFPRALLEVGYAAALSCVSAGTYSRSVWNRQKSI